MENKKLERGDVVQINPDHENFPGFLLVVTEPKSFGAQGYLLSEYEFHATRLQGVAYLRVKFEEIEFVGKIFWMNENKIIAIDNEK